MESAVGGLLAIRFSGGGGIARSVVLLLAGAGGSGAERSGEAATRPGPWYKFYISPGVCVYEEIWYTGVTMRQEKTQPVGAGALRLLSRWAVKFLDFSLSWGVSP